MELNLVILLFVVLNHKNWNQQQSSELKHLSEHFTFLSKIFFLYSFSNVESKTLSSKFDCNSDSKVNKGLQHDT